MKKEIKLFIEDEIKRVQKEIEHNEKYLAKALEEVGMRYEDTFEYAFLSSGIELKKWWINVLEEILKLIEKEIDKNE